MANQRALEITTNGRLVQIAVMEGDGQSVTAFATAVSPDDAEAIGQRLIQVARIARITSGVCS